MRDKPTHDEAHHASETDHDPKDGGGRAKWLIGGAAALLLLGAGYFAWKTVAPGDGVETASIDPYAEAPLYDAEIGPAGATQTQAPDNTAAPAAASETPAPARARRSTARAAAPEQTIGITPASATATDSEEIVVTGARRPIWASVPSPRRLSALYPARALERGREGEARLHCIVQAGGTLDCERVSETPGGFGAAALRVARRFRHASTLADGSDATGAPVRLRVVFRMEDERRRG